MDYRLEVVVVPVADTDRAVRFYQRLGWRLDGDYVTSENLRVVQFTPPGSPCSVIIGTGLIPADRAPGPDPQHRSYRSLASFRDPDGNGWLLQEITTRRPGR
jgi:catechol 2,3-dioxygenase-like lactoylglutathione lyase family enzyme